RTRRRFIPARTGRGAGFCSPLDMPTVHPRSHGERRPAADTGGRAGGSSPLARGEVVVGAPPAGLPRFIPARTGRGRAGGNTAKWETVHPRSHGERAAGAGAGTAAIGS